MTRKSFKYRTSKSLASTSREGCEPSGGPFDADSEEQLAPLFEAISGNSTLLQQMIADLSELRETVGSVIASGDSVHTVDEECPDSRLTAEEVAELQAEREQLLQEIETLERELQTLQQDNCELKRQNSDLAAKVASSSLKRSLTTSSSDSNEALSWEERKKLIFRQMEEDTFDAESFLNQTKHAAQVAAVEPSDDQPLDPIAFVEQLSEELVRRDRDLSEKDRQIGELNHLLEQRPAAGQEGVAFGAAAIAGMLDGDELILQERERLQQLQSEWEEKFRQSEIEASLERAKLSRERQELSKKTAVLEEQLDRLRRDAKQDEQSEGHSRRWLVKLGLACDDE